MLETEALKAYTEEFPPALVARDQRDHDLHLGDGTPGGGILRDDEIPARRDLLPRGEGKFDAVAELPVRKINRRRPRVVEFDELAGVGTDIPGLEVLFVLHDFVNDDLPLDGGRD